MKNEKLPFVKNLIKNKKSIFSQTIEDGIIEEIFKNIGTTNKYFVEFGAWDGTHLSNTANLRINEKWMGLLLEGNEKKAEEHSHITHAFVTAENINKLFEVNNVPKEFDLMSIDIDGNDFWVWNAIDDSKFSPRVVIIEYNCNFADQYRSCAVKYCPETDTTIPSIYYYSASIPALKKLGESKGYSLVFRVNLHNLFFIKTELLNDDDINIPLNMFLNKDGKAKKYKSDIYKGSDAIIYGDTSLAPHWNEYANSSISIYWDHDPTKEWVNI